MEPAGQQAAAQLDHWARLRKVLRVFEVAAGEAFLAGEGFTQIAAYTAGGRSRREPAADESALLSNRWAFGPEASTARTLAFI
jgi:hypothetical protein